MELEITVQIFSGSYLKQNISYEDAERKLDSILSRLPVTKVKMGWSPDKTLYEKTADYLAKRNINFYFWFSVFSETGAIRKLDSLVDFNKQVLINHDDKTNENFAFFCPNSEKNIEKIIDIFNSNFASLPFSGIFLDKIRFPSFANKHGFNGVFSCFCPECKAVYENENFDIKKLKHALSSVFSSPLGITEYCGNGKYIFDDDTLSEFFRIKADIIYKKLKQLCLFFKQKKYSIGFDVFAPFLSTFVGQDLKRLSSLCDFLKPMMYRITHAPAGLPFETQALLQQTGILNAEKIKRFYQLLGINFDSDEKSTSIKKPFNLAFSAKELKNLCKVSACPVYAGIEINRVKDIAETDSSYIKETIKAYVDSGVQGMALSWNLLDMPDDNIDKTIDVINKLS